MHRTQIGRLANAASVVGADMLARCRAAPSDARVTISVDEFRQIAQLLRQAASAVQRDHGGLDPDGFRFWLPLPQLEAQQRELNALRDKARRTATLTADSFRF